MNTVKKYLFLAVAFITSVTYAQRGKDGNVTVNTAARIVNEYTTLTADAAAGATTISVAASGLNANSRFSGALAPGDLIMIIQMQGVSVNGFSVEFPASSGQFYGFPNDKTIGEITSYNNCGNYEFAEVNAVPNATSITVDCGLLHAYTFSGRVQVIRVPRYNTLTVTNPGTITPQNWGATFTGGVVAVEVLGNTLINNANGLTASSFGFRGGVLTGDNVSGLGGGQVARNNNSEGAEKGEGVLGYQNDYNVIGGRYARGAIGNAGGGANCHNAGGGGGANAGSLVGWDGEGNPDVSGGAGWVNAWNLEGGTFSTHTSPGGGRGGYSFAANDENATTLGPKPFQGAGTNAWGGDYRINNGGWGGRPLDYSTGKLFMGGGGGAGDQDNFASTPGARGGGLVYLMSYGTVSGSGSVTANGGSATASGIDGAGGGGAGGTIIINSVGLVSGITASANGGAGGNQDIPGLTVMQSEGPGGGGGGGYIAVSTGAIAQTVNPGANGTTDSDHLTEFIPNGATRGAVGLASQTITNFTINGVGATICSGNTASITASISGTAPAGATIEWYTTQTGGSSIGSGSPFTTPVLSGTTTYYVGVCQGGTYRIPVVVTVNPGPTLTLTSAPATTTQNICLTSPIATITYTVGGSATGAGATGLPSGVTGNYAAGVFTISGTPTATGTFNYTVTTTGGACPAVTATGTIIVNSNATITLTSAASTNNQTICLSSAITNITYSVGGGGTGAGVVGLPAGVTGSFAAGTFTISGTPTATGVFNYTVTTTGSCTQTTAGGTITVNPGPILTLTSAGTTIAQTLCVSTAITNITYSVGGTATGAGVTGLPAGVTGSFAGGTFTISGTPTVTGTFNYTVTTTGGACTQTTATGTITVNPNATTTLTSAAGTNIQTRCQSVAITNITYSIGGGGTGATVSGLPAGVTGTFSAGVFTISGTPTATGTFNYTVTTTGTCTQTTATGTITVNPNATITLSSAVGTNTQTVCQSVAITNITYTVGGGGTGAGVAGLPAGVTGSFAAGTFTISGTPTATGTFNYTVTTTGTCTQTTATGTITINPNATITLSSAVGTDAQAICETTAITNIAYAIGGGGTGAIVSGLPAGVTGSFAAGTFTISGTPTATGTFNYTVTTTGTCTQTTATGTITIDPNATITLSSAAGTDAQTLCVSTAITNIVYTIGGGGTGATVSGLPAGVTGNYAAGVFTISGTPTVTGPFIYTVTTTGTCTQTAATGSITIDPDASIALSSAVGTDAQTLCQPNAITTITYAIGGGGTNATVSGLPAGVTGSFASGTFTISGTPSVTGTFNYTVTTTGTCAQDSLSGTIIINPFLDATITDIATVCVSAVPFNMTAATTGGTWTGIGITDGVNGTFDPATGVGTYTITYTIPGSCGSMDTTVVTVGTSSDATITAPISICVGAAAFNLSAVTPGGTWTGTGITDGVNGTFDPGTATVGSHVITYTITGTCGATDTATINVTSLSNVTIANATPVCVGAPEFNLSAATSGGIWTGTGITDSVAGTFDPATSGIGTFTVTYTVSGSCGNVDTALVTITPNANATINSPGSLCLTAAAVNLTAATSGGIWTGTGITDSIAGTFNPATAGIGVHTITYTISGPCAATDTILITVNASANATITNAAPICANGAAFNYTAASLGGIWSGTGITDSITGTFDPATSGAGSFVITYTLSGSCSAVDTSTVTVVALPAVTVNSPTICAGQTANLTAGGATTFTWSAGTTVTGAASADVTPVSTATFTVTGTDNGCSNTAVSTVTVTPLPSIGVNSPTICAGQTANLTATGGTSYVWSAGATSTGTATANATPASTTTYTVVGTASGCANSAVSVVTVNALPTPSITSDVNSGCGPLCVQFTETVSTICSSVVYNFGDGSTSTVSDPSYCYFASGIYDVTITCTDANGCVGSTVMSNMIDVYPQPAANFTMSPSGMDLPPHTTVTFTDISIGGGSTFWYFGDPGSATNTSVLSSDTHTYDTEGQFIIMLVSTNSFGCTDTVYNGIDVVGEAIINVPNVFTPNGDGNNDVFYIASTRVRDLTCAIYDRWGLKLAEWNTVTGGWDGRTTSGAPAPDGVYYYILTVTAQNDSTIEKQGFLQLLNEK